MGADIAFFLKGLLIGFAIAVPVGPIGVLCIQRTLLFGARSGLASGTGAALADAFYGAIAAFGLTIVTRFLQDHILLVQGVGGFFLLLLGLKTLLKKPQSKDEMKAAVTHLHTWKEVMQDFSSTFLLTLTNPATILSFIAIFAAFGLVTGEEPDYMLASLMVGGVFAGSLLWWCTLSLGVGMLRHMLDRKALHFLNILSGLIIGGFGGFVLGDTVFAKLFS